ncbi:MAG: polymerase [Spirochaetaceae bacterium]|nr:polymerase [Spirochaetaceae bacterium]
MNRFGRMPVLLVLTCLAGSLYAQTPRIAVTGAIEWKKMEMRVSLALDLASAGLRLPTGRAQAEEIIAVEFASLLRPYILAIPVDSSTTVEDLIRLGSFSFLGPENIAGTAKRGYATLAPDFSSLSSASTLDLSILSSRLILHSRPMEIRRVLSPVPAASYSGIIIIASGELPVHGRRTGAFVTPCLFPKVWDTDMNLVYERNILDPAGAGKTLVRYAAEEDIFRDTPSGLSPEISALVGSNPLRIIARGVFGIRPTDPIIDREDALAILSLENNRRLLREGKVVIVLSDGALETRFEGAP